MKKQILWTTQTAMLLAVAVLSQIYLLPLFGAANPAGNLAVGSIVNLCLVIAVLTNGFWSGASVSVCTPFIAFMLGKIVYPQQILIVAFGNVTLVFVFWLIFGIKIFNKNLPDMARWATASIIGSVSKFIVLWLGMTKIFIELVVKNDSTKNAEQVKAMTAVITANFTWVQLITALSGSILAYGVYKVLKIALLNKRITDENRVHK